VTTSVFLFAHQDDEYGVFRQIVDERARGRRVICAYLTSGVRAGGDPAARNQESLDVLGRLGVAAQDVVFAGAALQIADGALSEALPLAADWLKPWLTEFQHLETVYIPAWEGGHPDHDALHAVAARICLELERQARIWQFSLYNAYRRPWLLFRVLSPLPANGDVIRLPIAWRERVSYLRHMLRYPTQRKTWIGLFPFVLAHYFINGRQDLQPIDLSRLHERPHQGRLYYEKRGFSTWPIMRERVANWLASRR
jgi:LmbE family N-acetylglucosaminyl deacetylase